MDGGRRLLRSIDAQRGRGGNATPAPLAAVGAGWRPAGTVTALPILEASPRRRRFGGRSGVALSFAQRLPRRLGTMLTAAFFGLVGVTGLAYGDQMAVFRAHHGEPHQALARLFGFGIERVVISGIAELKEYEILRAAGIDPLQSLPFVDAAEMQARLEGLPLVKQASVRKLYPNEIAITLTEREPYALWQNQGDVFVIAADGTVIDTMQDERFVNLPFVVGEGANTRVDDYLALRKAAGPLVDRISAATLVGSRRWNIRLDSGLVLQLPEHGAAEALARFVALNAGQHILDKDVMLVDLRQPDRMTLRLTEEAAAARADALKKRPKPTGGEV